MRSYLIAFLLILTCSAFAATPVKKESPTVAATAALLKEYQDVMKTKNGEGLRDKCDYFTANKVEGLTPENILAAVEKPVSPDARADAYVRWQLLSGVTGKFPDELRQRAILAYSRAPMPAVNPGLNHQLLERTLNRVGINNKEAEAGMNKEYTDAITKYRLAIEPILEFRDEFFSRLPAGFETYMAGLKDIYDRCSRGAPANDFWTTVSGGIRAWALTGGNAQQHRQLATAIDRIRAFVIEDRNKVGRRVAWESSDSYTGLRWHHEQTINNTKSLEEAITFLAERAKNPGGGGLEFKDK